MLWFADATTRTTYTVARTGRLQSVVVVVPAAKGGPSVGKGHRHVKGGAPGVTVTSGTVNDVAIATRAFTTW